MTDAPPPDDRCPLDLVFDVPILAVERLHEALGFQAPLDPGAISHDTPFLEWKMEVNDAPILRHIYRHFRPLRHLEFGTWEGFGTLCVMEECDATVWTLNLFEGERQPDGQPAYARKIEQPREGALRFLHRQRTLRVKKQTDAHGNVGRMYLERGFGHRVCQIYCDSRDWETSNYPPGFFDSCLIDGGHTVEVVASDTRKALALVRPGGLILWHDFCPLRTVLQLLPAPRGVVEAIQNDWAWLVPQMKELFWLYPSQILLGVRAGGSSGDA